MDTQNHQSRSKMLQEMETDYFDFSTDSFKQFLVKNKFQNKTFEALT